MLSNNTQFIGTATGYGTLDASHHSTVAIIYDPTTLPTPWPVLVTGLSLSILVALYGVLTMNNRHPDSDGSRSFPHIGDIIATVISAIRATTAFITAIRAVSTYSGRFQSPAALAVLSSSIIPSLFDGGISPLTLINGYSLLVASLATCIMTFSFYNHKLNYYAEWFLVGGTCPSVLPSCDRISRYPRPGCSDNGGSSQDLSKFSPQNELAFGEGTLGHITGIGCAFIVIELLVVSLIIFFRLRQCSISQLGHTFSYIE
jgi:hypothetical protein